MIFSIDPSGAGIYFALYIGFSAFLGIVTYLLLTTPGLIKAEFRSLFIPVSKKTAAICAAIAMLPFSVYGYRDCWGYYYWLAVEDNRVIVRYLFPQREYALPLDDLKVASESEVRKGLVYRITLASKGNKFTSQFMTRAESEARLQALNKEIQRHTGLSKAVER